ncbi:MAG: cysteine--tRNA ligase [bacterium]|nr:cysteine--tRNA ligase [bacterium]
MLKFFNTLTREKQEFVPIHKDKVRMYTCGPTVYDRAHIGNMRAFIFADVLKRALLYNKFEVKHVMNITDVGHLTGDRDMGEDKLAKAAHVQRKTAWEIASFYTDAFLQDIRELNILTPDKLPKATDHIKDMISLIEQLEKKGFTYQTSDGIYFDTSKFPGYGRLAKLDIEGLKGGARVEINKEKKNLTDFALWKFSPPDSKRDMQWQSPWGLGFPGWHIECSAMSVKYLGQPFDIHTGGIDHIPLHHTNEIAQTESATGKPLANFWMHSEFLTIDEGRVGKSEGNAITLDELKSRGISPTAYRYFVLQGHYRTKLNFSWQGLEGAQNALNNIYSTIAQYPAPKIGCAEFEKDFLEGVNDDLDTPKALAVVWDLIHSDYPEEAKLKSLFEFDKVLGLSLSETWQELRKPLPEEIDHLVRQREAARSQKDFKKSDAIRAQIESQGFEISDTETGPLVKRKTSH